MTIYPCSDVAVRQPSVRCPRLSRQKSSAASGRTALNLILRLSIRTCTHVCSEQIQPIVFAREEISKVRTSRLRRNLSIRLSNFITRLPLDGRVSNSCGEKSHGPNGVIICRDEKVCVVRITVGVGDSNNGNTEAPRLMDRQ